MDHIAHIVTKVENKRFSDLTKLGEYINQNKLKDEIFTIIRKDPIKAFAELPRTEEYHPYDKTNFTNLLMDSTLRLQHNYLFTVCPVIIQTCLMQFRDLYKTILDTQSTKCRGQYDKWVLSGGYAYFLEWAYTQNHVYTDINNSCKFAKSFDPKSAQDFIDLCWQVNKVTRCNDIIVPSSTDLSVATMSRCYIAGVFPLWVSPLTHVRSHGISRPAFVFQHDFGHRENHLKGATPETFAIIQHWFIELYKKIHTHSKHEETIMLEILFHLDHERGHIHDFIFGKIGQTELVRFIDEIGLYPQYHNHKTILEKFTKMCLTTDTILNFGQLASS